MQITSINKVKENSFYREQLDSRFPQINEVFDECMREAKIILSPQGIDSYIDQARFLGGMGRGVEPMLLFLQKWPQVAAVIGEASLPIIKDAIYAIWKSPNANAITFFLESLPAITIYKLPF